MTGFVGCLILPFKYVHLVFKSKDFVTDVLSFQSGLYFFISKLWLDYNFAVFVDNSTFVPLLYDCIAITEFFTIIKLNGNCDLLLDK
jgi:hypothetical protein